MLLQEFALHYEYIDATIINYIPNAQLLLQIHAFAMHTTPSQPMLYMCQFVGQESENHGLGRWEKSNHSQINQFTIPFGGNVSLTSASHPQIPNSNHQTNKPNFNPPREFDSFTYFGDKLLFIILLKKITTFWFPISKDIQRWLRVQNKTGNWFNWS